MSASAVFGRDGARLWDTYDFNASTQGLFAKDMQVCLDGFDSLFCVDCGDSRDENGFETSLLEHLVVVIIQLHAIGFEMSLGPC